MQKPTQVIGRRVAALIIDTLISFAISVAAFFALTTQVPGKCPPGGGGYTIGDNCRGFLVGQSGKQTAFYAIVFVLSIALFWVLPGIKGWSPGKLAVGIRVVNAEGRPPGVLRSILRSILWIVDGFPYIIPYLVGFITALNSARNQRVGDMAAGTFVVDKSAMGASLAAAPAAQFGPPPGGAPFNAPPAQPPQPPAQPPQQQGGQKADWYPDPQGQARLRYWDGQRWTEHTSA